MEKIELPQFLCSDTDKFIIELKQLIDKYTSESIGLDTVVTIEIFN